MTVGYVLQEKIKIEGGAEKSFLSMIVRVPFGSFTATISKVKEKQKENSPDYEIWYSPNRKGETFDRMKVGALWMKKSKAGNKYLSGYVDTPLAANGKMYISIVKFTRLEHSRAPENVVYSVLWSPQESSSGPDSYGGGYEEYGYADYSQQAPQQPNDAPTYDVEVEGPEQEIPF